MAQSIVAASANPAINEKDCCNLLSLRVGPWFEGEFLTLNSVVSIAGFPVVEDLDQAEQWLSETDSLPETLLLAQPRPDYYSEPRLSMLQQHYPLIRMILVAGTWCEGELRTGTPLAGVLRVYWYKFPYWWNSACERYAEGRCPAWSEPLDSPVPAWRNREVTARQELSGGVIAIAAEDVAVFQSLTDCLTSEGYQTYWWRSHEQTNLPASLVAGIWDGGQLSVRELQRLQQFARIVLAKGATTVALVDFPRRETFSLAQSAGAPQVIAKPYQLEELLRALQAARVPAPCA